MIERGSPLPLYHQLKEILATQIRAGEWKAGDLIPGEQELQSTYALSRTTVRQALRELELDGLLTRHRGRGTFVSRPKLTHDADPARGLPHAASERGVQASWRVLDAAWVPAADDVAARLKVSPGDSVHRLRRIRLVDGEPIGHHVAFVPAVFREFIQPSAFTRGSSLAYLETHVALRGSTVDRLLEANAATDEDVDLLALGDGEPVLSIRRLVVSRGGVPMEDCRSTYRGDRFQYHFRTELLAEERPCE